VPPDNCAAALTANPVNDLRLVRAPTMKSALKSIQAFVRDPDAELPRCE
jgi:PDZ domain-containing protein